VEVQVLAQLRFLGGLFREQSALSPTQRFEVAVARRLNPYFQIKSLRHFNAKFLPEWHPRYIYYEAPLSFPRVGLAYMEAEAFLRLPLIGMRGRLRDRVPLAEGLAGTSDG
jgi:lysyl-tRNA synthetase, class II